jgi:hypothetical protein
MECLKFGHHTELINNEKINIGLFGLHLQSPWRFVNDQKIIIGSFDVYEHPTGKYIADFKWASEKNLRDFLLQVLITKNKLTVIQTSADKYGGFEMVFSNNFKLQVFPALSLKDEYAEFWRIISNHSSKEEHFVVGGNGAYISADKKVP